MRPIRLLAILCVYGCTALAWFALGGTIISRTGEFDHHLKREVESLWGGHHIQTAPGAEIERPREVVENVVERNPKGEQVTRQVSKTVFDRIAVPLASNKIDVALKLNQRRKGLLWYATYEVAFVACYTVRNPDPEPRTLRVSFAFPSQQAIYDDFVFRVNDQEAPPANDLSKELTTETTLRGGEEGAVEVRYRSRGLSDWTYAFAKQGVTQVRDFALTLKTDFAAIDFPAGTISPSEKTREGAGWRLLWKFASLAAGQKIGIEVPSRLNPGPVAARITFFAPVGLLFFLTVMVVLGLLHGRSLHPANYFFLAAAFFAFHLLLAYLVDHMEINVAFAISSVVSVFLVVSYLRLVSGMRVALLQAGLAQFVFLVLFSYAFFFEGITGLTVTIGAVLTLYVLMQLTARVDWQRVFSGSSSEPV